MPDKEKQEEQEKILKDFVESQESVSDIPQIGPQIGPKIIEIPGTKVPWERDVPLGNQIGWIPIPVKDLPTRGLFYPADTTMAIRAALGAEIRHWSTLQEDDLSAADDMLNYVVERCVTVKSSENEGIRLSWKDIKEIDRFYIILAIHELTFSSGENKLQIKISDTKKLDVKKDMISFINLDQQIMKYYDETERCFVLRPKNRKEIKVDIPSIGVTQWLKHYIIRKRNAQEPIDEDFLTFAPLLIRSWRGLIEDVYHKYVEDSNKWDVLTVSILSNVRKLFADTINPVIKYIDEGGAEQTAPLNFQGGLKAVFIIPDALEQLE